MERHILKHVGGNGNRGIPCYDDFFQPGTFLEGMVFDFGDALGEGDGRYAAASAKDDTADGRYLIRPSAVAHRGGDGHVARGLVSFRRVIGAHGVIQRRLFGRDTDGAARCLLIIQSAGFEVVVILCRSARLRTRSRDNG